MVSRLFLLRGRSGGWEGRSQLQLATKINPGIEDLARPPPLWLNAPDEWRINSSTFFSGNCVMHELYVRMQHTARNILKIYIPHHEGMLCF
jgi:hypothetical protein